ncbi:hypothetical protein V1478_005090 [Vespula squamosa]|uniref:Uncharacterized protein n=1 Tax=Vespula squamosa TaxID=30214 RepID=A0ABD2BD46_VESSQ
MVLEENQATRDNKSYLIVVLTEKTISDIQLTLELLAPNGAYKFHLNQIYFCYIFKRKFGSEKMHAKKHEATNDLCSDIVETSELVSFDKRMIKKCHVITSLSESKENRGQKLHQSEKNT